MKKKQEVQAELILLNKILREVIRMTQSQQDLDTSLDQLVADVAALTTAVTANSTAIAALLAKLAAAGSTDFTTEVNKVKATDTAVTDAVAQITADDAKQ
jgi:hypothetical protein